jgi:hypothetical protein
MDPEKAKKAILGGEAPDGLIVKGVLDLSKEADLTRLPHNLQCPRLILNDCENLVELPAGLRVPRIEAANCTRLGGIPEDIDAYEVDLSNTAVRAIPPGVQVEFRLIVADCHELTRLPEGFSATSLVLRGCDRLVSLPENLDVCFLDVEGCTALEEISDSARITIGRLNARGCIRLKKLPQGLGKLAQVDVSGCTLVDRLPEGCQITSWLDVADSGITSLPERLKDTPLRWRGVPVSARIAFEPETITGKEVLAEENAELRRVMMERMGFDRFIEEVDAEVLDEDTDAGGPRKLLRVRLEGDEDLVCVSVLCPSTGRQYLLRVPPSTKTCRQGVAWTAGFDNPDDYEPLSET